ncbi:MAG: hypothetical protein ACE5Z5_05535 [Candidatus Bathyarchaeia archaeon]
MGLVEVKPSLETPSSIRVRAGESVNITVLLHFISHTPNITEVKVRLDPISSEYRVEQYYAVLDENGSIVDRGKVEINDLINYDTPEVIVRANETLPITMTLTIPKDFPLSRPSTYPNTFPLSVVGVHVLKPHRGWIASVDQVYVKVRVYA